MSRKIKKQFEDFKKGFMQGSGWSFGVAFGFVLLSTILYLLVHFLGGLPLIGTWIASLVKATQSALYR